MDLSGKRRLKMKLHLEEAKIYEVIYWAIRDVFDEALREGVRRLDRSGDISSGILLLNIVYEAIREGVYKAFRDALFSGIIDLRETCKSVRR
ncbi:MAG: hypothetical protein DRJ49_00685 [Thermoprotei archaeon]|nr:MAG: hypothetical protein DRJ49_00685 [Thermoprotei archaeon]RLG36024.1 MAG: hypothetical protein DRN91_08815 [Candidatus Alkanophagales archaeon]